MTKSKFFLDLKGHALVFGASGDIGSEVVRQLVANGIKNLTFTYGKNKQAAAELAASISAEGVSVYYESINLSDDSAVHTFLEKAVEVQGEEISSMVFAVGISPNKSFLKQKLETTGPGDDIGWREVFEVNLFGCVIATRAVAERMKRMSVKGAIVLITSTNGVNSYSQISFHYDCSKAAQILFMRGVAEEYAPFGISINGVAPGWILTKMNKTLPEDEREKETKRILMGRWAKPVEVANQIILLISEDASSYVCGQNIMVDGCYK
jgi:NAD(P)-dependent dehydrogenase (short-subunit alcohol dehydrogenase family)